MSNHTSSILASVYLDQVIDQGINLGNFCTLSHDFMRGSLFNPLQTMRLLTLDEDGSYESEDLAAATGVPADWFDDELLAAPFDEVLVALGKMALIYFSSLRNQALEHAPIEKVREDTLRAVATFAEVSEMNRKRRAH